jgi:hypothetical protein
MNSNHSNICHHRTGFIHQLALLCSVMVLSGAICICFVSAKHHHRIYGRFSNQDTTILFLRQKFLYVFLFVIMIHNLEPRISVRIGIAIFLCHIGFSWLLIMFLPTFWPALSSFFVYLVRVQTYGTSSFFLRQVSSVSFVGSVIHRLRKSPRAFTYNPYLAFSYISRPSNRPDRLIIFLLLPKFRRLSLSLPSATLDSFLSVLRDI